MFCPKIVGEIQLGLLTHNRGQNLRGSIVYVHQKMQLEDHLYSYSILFWLNCVQRATLLLPKTEFERKILLRPLMKIGLLGSREWIQFQNLEKDYSNSISQIILTYFFESLLSCWSRHIESFLLYSKFVYVALFILLFVDCDWQTNFKECYLYSYFIMHNSPKSFNCTQVDSNFWNHNDFLHFRNEENVAKWIVCI